MHTVAVLALPDVIAFDVATPVEVFGHARLPDGRPAYRVIVCGSEPTVTAGPLRISTDTGLEGLERADSIIVPGRNEADAPVPPAVVEALRRAHADGARIASICVGAFVIAEAGLLDGRRATTHWRASALLSQRYPEVEVDPDALYIDEGSIVTSAGAAAGLDLCLHLVQRDHGVAVAADASRIAVAPVHRAGGQSPYIVRNPRSTATVSLGAVLGWVEENAHRQLSLADIATAAHSSVRTLNRRFHAETGQSPMEWVTGVRVRHAQELLETTDHGVERIARHVGFASASTLRGHFRRLVGTTPNEYRSTFTGRPSADKLGRAAG